MNWRPMTEEQAHVALRFIDDLVHALITIHDQIERNHRSEDEDEAFACSITWDEFVKHLTESNTPEP